MSFLVQWFPAVITHQLDASYVCEFEQQFFNQLEAVKAVMHGIRRSGMSRQVLDKKWW